MLPAKHPSALERVSANGALAGTSMRAMGGRPRPAWTANGLDGLGPIPGSPAAIAAGLPEPGATGPGSSGVKTPAMRVRRHPIIGPAIESGCEAGDGVVPGRPVAVLAR